MAAARGSLGASRRGASPAAAVLLNSPRSKERASRRPRAQLAAPGATARAPKVGAVLHFPVPPTAFCECRAQSASARRQPPPPRDRAAERRPPECLNFALAPLCRSFESQQVPSDTGSTERGRAVEVGSAPFSPLFAPISSPVVLDQRLFPRPRFSSRAGARLPPASSLDRSSPASQLQCRFPPRFALPHAGYYLLCRKKEDERRVGRRRV